MKFTATNSRELTTHFREYQRVLKDAPDRTNPTTPDIKTGMRFAHTNSATDKPAKDEGKDHGKSEPKPAPEPAPVGAPDDVVIEKTLPTTTPKEAP